MTEIFILSDGKRLLPMTSSDLEAIDALPRNTPLMMKPPTAPRSWKQHKWFFTLCAVTFRAMPEARQIELGPCEPRFRYYLHVKVGHCSSWFVPPVELPDELLALWKDKSPRMFFRVIDGPDCIEPGILVNEAKSIAYHAMDGSDFKPFVRRVVTFITHELLPGVQYGDLIDLVEGKTKIRLRSL